MCEGKTCSTCKIYKPLINYYKDKNKVMGVENQCKQCRKIVKQNYYQKNKEKYKIAFQSFLLRNPDYYKNRKLIETVSL